MIVRQVGSRQSSSPVHLAWCQLTLSGQSASDWPAGNSDNIATHVTSHSITWLRSPSQSEQGGFIRWPPTQSGVIVGSVEVVVGAGRGREEIQSRVEDVGGVSVSISVVCSDSTAQHTLGSDRHTTPRTLQTSLLL